MRPSALFIFAATAAHAAPGSQACSCNPSGKCLSAIREVPAVGEAFCSSWLSLEPVSTVTTVITQIETITSTWTNIQTSKLLTVATLTSTTTAPQTTVTSGAQLQQRDAVADAPFETILDQCSTRSARISNACGCFLTDAVAPTVTVYETVISTESAEYASTTTETLISSTTTTETTNKPAATMYPDAVANGGFASYLTSDKPTPWEITYSEPRPGIEYGYTAAVGLGNLNLCSANPVSCVKPPAMPRMHPPFEPGASVTISQEITTAQANIRYGVSFLFLCYNTDTTANGAPSTVQVFYKGIQIGTTLTCVPNRTFTFYRESSFGFIFDGTAGKLEFKFTNPSPLLPGTQRPYFYLADVSAIGLSA